MRRGYTTDGRAKQQNVRLLIAEDHPSLARSMAEGLREEGYEVDLALDGIDAERIINRNQYSCVILDLILPGKDGLALLKEMRQHGRSVAGHVRDGARCAG